MPFFSKQLWAYPEVRQVLAESRRLILLCDPLYMLGPSWNRADPEELGRRLLPVCAGCLGIGVGFLIPSAWMLRKAAPQSLEAPPNRKVQGPKREPVAEDQPISWRERKAREADLAAQVSRPRDDPPRYSS